MLDFHVFLQIIPAAPVLDAPDDSYSYTVRVLMWVFGAMLVVLLGLLRSSRNDRKEIEKQYQKDFALKNVELRECQEEKTRRVEEAYKFANAKIEETDRRADERVQAANDQLIATQTVYYERANEQTQLVVASNASTVDALREVRTLMESFGNIAKRVAETADKGEDAVKASEALMDKRKVELDRIEDIVRGLRKVQKDLEDQAGGGA